jgi:hypothetical protein
MKTKGKRQKAEWEDGGMGDENKRQKAEWEDGGMGDEG